MGGWPSGIHLQIKQQIYPNPRAFFLRLFRSASKRLPRRRWEPGILSVDESTFLLCVLYFLCVEETLQIPARSARISIFVFRISPFFLVFAKFARPGQAGMAISFVIYFRRYFISGIILTTLIKSR